MWRHQDGGEPRVINLRPGTALTIPVDTKFQFCNTGREPLSAIGITMPPWPGEGEAIEVDGPWKPKLAPQQPDPRPPGHQSG
jgi:mannose-6-phosphate isomerase-like protein (cupin superfamily)